jgi:putative sigma-54 modulation protein
MTVDLVVFGKHVDVSNRLKSFTAEKIGRIEKYANDVRRVEVDYSTIPNRRVAENQTCEILVHLKGHLVKGHAAATDHHAALDLALEKVERQMRRLHERRTQRSKNARGRRNGSRARASASSAEGSNAGVADDLDDLDGLLQASGDGAAARDGGGEPAIVKRKQFLVKPMDPEEAALQMELLDHSFFLFTNAENGRAAVIYRRRDHNLGLIESA